MRRSLLDRLDAAHDPDRFLADVGQMLPLPGRGFVPSRRTLQSSRSVPWCASKALFTRCPCQWAGLDVTAHVGADDVEITCSHGSVTHERKRFGEKSIDYRHYLPELAKKPQAVRQVAAELIRDLGPSFAAAWRSLVDAHGPKQAARIFAKVLGHVETRAWTKWLPHSMRHSPTASHCCWRWRRPPPLLRRSSGCIARGTPSHRDQCGVRRRLRRAAARRRVVSRAITSGLRCHRGTCAQDAGARASVRVACTAGA